MAPIWAKVLGSGCFVWSFAQTMRRHAFSNHIASYANSTPMIIFVWRACPATTNGNAQAHHNVNCDGVNLTLLGSITRGRAFDDR
ncbi:hypothetical protein F4604DRAFT_1629461, partial [Suillus subluteus]